MVSVKDFPDQSTQEEQILFVLNYAVRSPSTHNSQPWLFRIKGNTLEILADWTRKLPEGDRDGRDICISLGACVEHATTAFTYFNMLESVSINDHFAIDSTEPCATFTLRQGQGKNDSLGASMHAIETRFNARGPFIKKPVPDETLRKVMLAKEDGVSIRLITETNDLQKFAELTGEGMRAAHCNPKFRGEIARWMISNYSKKKEGIPGYTMLAPGLLSLVLPTIIGRYNTGGVLSKLNYKSINSSSGAIIFSSDDTPSDWLRVGILFARISLIFNTESIYTSVYVASIETPDVRGKLQHAFSLSKKPQFACSFGYPKITLKQSPRHAPEERVVQ